MLQLKKAVAKDLEQIMKIYRCAQDYMIENGNPTQWGHSYPDESVIRKDIDREICMVIFDETGIHGVCSLLEGIELSYEYIEDGHWLNEDPYISIHRMAGDGQVRGLFSFVAGYCKGISDNIRVDTHADNLTMQHLIEKNGFVRCGTVYIRGGSPRIAYQWTKEIQ